MPPKQIPSVVPAGGPQNAQAAAPDLRAVLPVASAPGSLADAADQLLDEYERVVLAQLPAVRDDTYTVLLDDGSYLTFSPGDPGR